MIVVCTSNGIELTKQKKVLLSVRNLFSICMESKET